MHDSNQRNYLQVSIKYLSIFILSELFFIIFFNFSILSAIFIAIDQMINKGNHGYSPKTLEVRRLSIFLWMNLTISIASYLGILFVRMKKIPHSFNLPYRGEIVIIISAAAFHYFAFSSLVILGGDASSMKRDYSKESLDFVFWFAAFISWFIGAGSLGLLRLVIAGSENERKQIDYFLRGVTFMKFGEEDSK